MGSGGMNGRRLQEHLEAIAGRSLGTGKVFVVGLTTDSWYRQFQRKLPSAMTKGSLATAVAACTAGQGDTILIMPGTHAISTAVTLAKADVSIVGVKGRKKATVVAGTGAITTLTVSGADCRLEGITLSADNASGQALDVSGARFTAEDVLFSGESNNPNLVEVNTAADDADFVACEFRGGAEGLFITTTSGAAPDNLTIDRCTFRANTTIHLSDSGASTTVCSNLLVKDCDFVTDPTNELIKLDTINHTGLITRCSFPLADMSTAEIDIPASGTMFFVNNFDETSGGGRPA